MSNSNFWENCEANLKCIADYNLHAHARPRISRDTKMKSNYRQTYLQVPRQPPKFRHSNP